VEIEDTYNAHDTKNDKSVTYMA